MSLICVAYPGSESFRCIFSLNFLLILIFLPRYTAHRHHILHGIAFLPEMRYACAAPIVEICTIAIETVSHLPSSVKRVCSFAKRRSRSAPGALGNLSSNGMLSGNQRQLQHMKREYHERCA